MDHGYILVCLAKKAGWHSDAAPDIGVILLNVGASIRRIGELIAGLVFGLARMSP
jgi:hypothetical protein